MRLLMDLTFAQLEGLQANTWVIGMAVLAVMLVAAIIMSFVIKDNANHGRPQVPRRNWFIILGIAGPAVYYCLRLNEAVEVADHAMKVAFQDTCIWVLGVSIVGYFVVGLLLAAILRHSKFGSILSK